MHCPASYLLEQQYPRTENFAATEGTAAAKLAEWDLKNNVDPRGCKGAEVEGVIVTEEMVDYVRSYTTFCRSLGGSVGGVEHHGEFDATGNTVSGTMDFWAYSHPVLHIVDLKYGRGWVYPEENWQLMAYAIIISQTLPAPASRIKFHIYQPRAANRAGGPAYSWEFDGELLRNYRNQIENKTGVAALQHAPAVTGDHCRYCRAIIGCTTNARTAGECLDISMRSDSYTPTPEEVGSELDLLEVALSRLTHRKTALEAHGLSLIQSGIGVPGFVSDQTMGNLSWVVDAIKAGDEMGVDLRGPEKPITPTQAKDRKLIAPEMLKFMAKRAPGAFKLKRVDMDAIRRIING